MSMDTNTIHPHIAHTDDHQPSPNCRYAANGASTIRAPAGEGTPTKYSLVNAGAVSSSRSVLKRASRNTMQTP
ncbi:Uncharacterised protein [Mycobacteroides abscessus subsp. abscessus]|nr:Uncharacterised protein [Mycobacteroides abscessus subsp. abscessus]